MFKSFQSKQLLVFIFIAIAAISSKNGLLPNFNNLLINQQSLSILFSIGCIIIFLFYIIFIFFWGKTKKNLLKKGFIEGEGTILAIEELGSFGKPANHALTLQLTIKVTSPVTSAFEAQVKTTITEYGNAALSYQRRVPNYELGQKILIMYKPQNPSEVIIPIQTEK